VWKDDFNEKPVKGMPKASIHEISTMVDKGIIKEEDVGGGSVSTIKLNSGKNQEGSQVMFSDGKVSRGFEEVHRVYIASYEDENRNLHGSHHLYIVVGPATWTFHKERAPKATAMPCKTRRTSPSSCTIKGSPQ
jgi:hypothetical protein